MCAPGVPRLVAPGSIQPRWIRLALPRTHRRLLPHAYLTSKDHKKRPVRPPHPHWTLPWSLHAPSIKSNKGAFLISTHSREFSLVKKKIATKLEREHLTVQREAQLICFAEALAKRCHVEAKYVAFHVGT